MNVIYIFNSAPRHVDASQSNDHCRYALHLIHDVSPMTYHLYRKHLGMHHIRLEIFSLLLSKFHSLENPLPIQINTAIVLDIQIDKSSFLNLSFANKVLEAIALSNIIHNLLILKLSLFLKFLTHILCLLQPKYKITNSP